MDASGEFSIFDWLAFENTLSVQWVNNSINWVKYGRIWSPENVGVRATAGLDNRVHGFIGLKSGPFGRIDYSLFYQFLWNYLLTDSWNFEDDLRVPEIPVHMAGFTVSLVWNAGSPSREGSLLLSGHYEGLRFADPSNLLQMKPYFRLNATVNQRVGKHFSLFLALRNILNVSYESFVEYPMPGITLSVGGSLRLGTD
jgi:vitamin B12 transporter